MKAEPPAEPERGFVLAVLRAGSRRRRGARRGRGARAHRGRRAGRPSSSSTGRSPAPRTYVGKGKLEELKEAFERRRAPRRCSSTTSSTRRSSGTLENALQARVVDRTQLILDIFAQHAVSAEGKLQVELAQLEYNLPRMRGMWQHLERLGGGVGTRGPGESQLETDRRLARRRISRLQAPAEGASSSSATTRRKERRAHRDADGRARRLHERRQVDAPERAHRRRRLGREPALRDARPDDARVRARGPALPRHRHRRLHPPAAAPARRGLRGDARGDARRRPRPARRRRLGAARSGSTSRSPRSTPCWTRSAPTSCRSSSSLNKIDAVDALAPAPAREPLPRRAAGLRADRRGARRAARADRRALRRALRGGAAALPYDEGGKLAELYALGAPIEEREDTRGGRARPRAPAAPRAAPLRAVPRRRCGVARRRGA